MARYRIDREALLDHVRELIRPGGLTPGGISHGKLAQLLDMKHRGVVSHWFNPARPDQMPSLQNCLLLCGHLGIDLLEFVEEA